MVRFTIEVIELESTLKLNLTNIVGGLILAGLLGIGTMLFQLNNQVITLTAQVAYITEQINELKSQNASRYTLADALADFRLRDERIDNLNKEVNNLKQKVEALRTPQNRI